MPQQKFEIEIPEEYGPDEREAIASEILDFIRERTERGYDKDNKPFPKYSKSYKQSFEFMAGGKSNRVNLRLSGDMMAELDLLQHKRGRLVFGYAKGSEINDRVEGNVTGSYGGEPDPSRARDFLGIAKRDLKNILAGYPVDDRESARERADRINQIDLEAEKFAGVNRRRRGVEPTEED